MNVAVFVGLALSIPLFVYSLSVWPPGFRMATIKAVGHGNGHAVCGVGP